MNPWMKDLCFSATLTFKITNKHFFKHTHKHNSRNEAGGESNWGLTDRHVAFRTCYCPWTCFLRQKKSLCCCSVEVRTGFHGSIGVLSKANTQMSHATFTPLALSVVRVCWCGRPVWARAQGRQALRSDWHRHVSSAAAELTLQIRPRNETTDSVPLGANCADLLENAVKKK